MCAGMPGGSPIRLRLDSYCWKVIGLPQFVVMRLNCICIGLPDAVLVPVAPSR